MLSQIFLLGVFSGKAVGKTSKSDLGDIIIHMSESVTKEIENFFSKYKHQKFKKGEILVRADDDPSGIFFLKEGMVKEYAISQKGEELIVNIFKQNAFFPMSWAINRTPNSYFFEAMTDTEVWKAPDEDVVTFIRGNPSILYDLLSRVYRGTDGLLSRMTFLMSASAYSRLVSELLVCAKRFGKGNTNVELNFSEKDLASQTGMTRETISREIRILKDNSLVAMQKGKLIIKDLQSLEDELGTGV